MERRSQAWWLAGLVLALGLGWLLARRVERGGANATERAEARTQAFERTELVSALPLREAEPATLSAPAMPTAPGRAALAAPREDGLGEIEGVVTLDGQKQAFRGGTVRVWWNHAHGAPRQGNLATATPVWPGSDGHFRLTGLPLDVPLVLRANSDHGPDFTLDLEPFVAGERRTLEVELESSTRIHGYVFDPEGLSLAGRELRLRPRPGGARVEGSRARLAVTTSEADGRFQFTRVPRGQWELEAGPEGRVEARAALDTRAGDVGPLHLVLVPVPTSSLAVRLRWPDGSGPESILYAIDGKGGFSPVESREGLVTLAELTHGLHALQFSAQEDGRAGSVEARVAIPYEGTLELQLVEGPMLRW